MSDPTNGDGTAKPSGSSAPGAFTPEQLEQIAQVAAQTFNSGFTARTKKLQTDISGDFAKLLEPITKRIDDVANAAPAGGKGKGGKKDDDETSSDPKLAGLQRQLADMQKSIDDRDRKIAEGEARQRRVDLRNSLTRTLTESGFTDSLRTEDAVDLLLARGQVKHDEDGNPVFVENENSVLDLANGVKAWAKSDRAKNFLPPTGARGSGDRPGQGAPKPGAQPQEATATDLGMALVRDLGGMSVG